MPVYAQGLRKKPRAWRWSLRATAIRQFPLPPYNVRLRSLRRVVRRVMRVALRDVSVVRGFLVVPCGVLVG